MGRTRTQIEGRTGQTETAVKDDANHQKNSPKQKKPRRVSMRKAQKSPAPAKPWPARKLTSNYERSGKDAPKSPTSITAGKPANAKETTTRRGSQQKK